jgi:hypothetical protein
MSHKVIVISGKQGSGKTTLSEALSNKLRHKGWSVAHLKFAGPLYQMHDLCLGILKEGGIERDIVKDGPLLQMLGTEWGRKTIDENIWVKLAQADIAQTVRKAEELGYEKLCILIDDCRFKNELEGLPEALRVRLECAPSVRKERCEAWRDNENHPSEIDLDDLVHKPGAFDVIFNTGTQTVEHCSTMIAAQLDKDRWLEKRNE